MSQMVPCEKTLCSFGATWFTSSLQCCLHYHLLMFQMRAKAIEDDPCRPDHAGSWRSMSRTQPDRQPRKTAQHSNSTTPPSHQNLMNPKEGYGRDRPADPRQHREP